MENAGAELAYADLYRAQSNSLPGSSVNWYNNDNDYNAADDDDDNDDQIPGEGVCRELEACVHCQAFDSSPEHCRDCNFVLDFLENDFIEESSHQFESDSPCVVKTSIDCKYKYSGNNNK